MEYMVIDRNRQTLRVDDKNKRMWLGEQEVVLKPKTFAVLGYLIARPDSLVTKEELLRAVWPGTHVSAGLIKGYVQEIRRALGDAAKAPRFIQTIHGRGYCFIGNAQTLSAEPENPHSSRSAEASQLPIGDNGRSTQRSHNIARSPPPSIVGRNTEFNRLYDFLEAALGGERQLVFVTGEPGIGKTTLVEAFLQQLTAHTGSLSIVGHCLSQYGTSEAYLPVLEALTQLAKVLDPQRLVPLLRQYAPNWLIQLPSLLSPDDQVALRGQLDALPQHRMLYELAALFETLSQETPLVLVLEDLHWSDFSTLDFVSYLAQRQAPARLLVLCTYRPADIRVSEHPLRVVQQELLLHQRCHLLPVPFLSEAAVEAYVTDRFSVQHQPPQPLHSVAHLIHHKTEGSPLFMVAVVEDLIAQGVFAHQSDDWDVLSINDTLPAHVPDTVSHLIERQLDQLDHQDQRVLEVSSLSGSPFSAAAVAAGLETSIELVEERCEHFVKHEQFLSPAAPQEWMDGTITGCYTFIHALYQEVLSQRLTPRRNIALHRAVGLRLEQGYGPHADNIAAELAIHFAHGRDVPRAVQYYGQAAHNAAKRYANQETIRLLTSGLDLLQTLPEENDRMQHELFFQIQLGQAEMAIKGYGAPEVVRAFDRARQLCQDMGEIPQLFAVLSGLWGYYIVRAQLQTAQDLAEQVMRLAQNQDDPTLLIQAHFALGCTLFYRGEFESARQSLEAGMILSDTHPPQTNPARFVQDPGVACYSYAALTLCLLGYPAQAVQRDGVAFRKAEALAHPYSLGFVRDNTITLYQCCRDWKAVHEHADQLFTLATQQEFPLWISSAQEAQGWVLGQQDQPQHSIAVMHKGLASFRATGTRIAQAYFLILLAEQYGKSGQAEEALTQITTAEELLADSGEGWYEAELHRIKGDLLLAGAIDNCEAAEACFQQALTTARRQGAKWWELRTTVSLSRLWQQQGKQAKAQKQLKKILGWFTEGHETTDYQEARALHDSL